MINHYRNEENSGAEGNINYSLKDSKSFDYKASIVESITDTDLTKETVKIVAPLKHLSNFWRTLNIPLIKYEISLTLTWSRNRVLISKTTVLEIIRWSYFAKNWYPNKCHISNNRNKIVWTNC